MSNRRKDAEAGGPMLGEPGPISFGAGPASREDEPGPINLGPSPAAKDDLGDLDFASGPKIALPDYITRAAQRWNPDSTPTAKAQPAAAPRIERPAEAEPPRFTPLPAFGAPADEPDFEPAPIQPKARVAPPAPGPRVRPGVQRPEPTYPAPLRPQPPAEEPKRYFTPLPEAGYAPAPPTPAPPQAEPAVEQQPLIQIQIHRLPPLFKGNGLMRGLFFGCALGVAVGGIAAVLMDLMQPKPQTPVILPKVINAQAVSLEADDTPTPKARKGARKPADKGSAKPDERLDLDRLQTTIRVQTAPPPKPVLRQGPTTPIEPESR